MNSNLLSKAFSCENFFRQISRTKYRRSSWIQSIF